MIRRDAAGGPVSDADEARVLVLLLRDIEATVGPTYARVGHKYATHLRAFCDDYADYLDRVVGDVQQYFHDFYIDTTWPTCPRHPHHPMWLRDDWWSCGDERIVKLGELASISRPRP